MSELLDSFPGDTQPWLDRAGLHAAIERPPAGDEPRLLFALLEAIGYECWKFQDAPEESEWEAIEAWMWENRKALLKIEGVPPPDYISLMLGKYTWLTTP